MKDIQEISSGSEEDTEPPKIRITNKIRKNVLEEPTPVCNIREESTPVVNIQEMATPVVEIQEEPTSVVNIQEGPTPVFNIPEEHTPVCNIDEESTLVCSIQVMPTPVLDIQEETTPVSNVQEVSTTADIPKQNTLGDQILEWMNDSDDEPLRDPTTEYISKEEEEELLRGPTNEQQYIHTLQNTILHLGGTVPTAPAEQSGSSRSGPVVGLISPSSSSSSVSEGVRAVHRAERTSREGRNQGSPPRQVRERRPRSPLSSSSSSSVSEGRSQGERTMSQIQRQRSPSRQVRGRRIQSQVSRVEGGENPAANRRATPRNFYNGNPGFWYHDDATAEWERRGGEIYSLGLIREAFRLRVAFVHVRTLNPLRREAYNGIRENLTGYISGGTSVDRVAARIGRAADILTDMRDSVRRMRESVIPRKSEDPNWDRIEAVSGELVEVPFRAPIHELEELWQDLDVRSGRILSSDNAIRLRRRIGDLIGDHLYHVSNLLKVWTNFIQYRR